MIKRSGLESYIGLICKNKYLPIEGCKNKKA